MDSTRDVIIILWGVLSILTLLVVLLVMLYIGLSVRTLLKTLTDLLEREVKPAIAVSQRGVSNVTGTAQFLQDTVLAPLLRVVRLLSAVRRGLAVFRGLRHRGR